MKLIRARLYMSKGECLKSSSMRIVGKGPSVRSTVKGSLFVINKSSFIRVEWLASQ